MKTLSHLPGTARTLSISYDGQFIATGAQNQIDISHINSGESVLTLSCEAINRVSWNPKKNLLAYATDELQKDKSGKETGYVSVYA